MIKMKTHILRIKIFLIKIDLEKQTNKLYKAVLFTHQERQAAKILKDGKV